MRTIFVTIVEGIVEGLCLDLPRHHAGQEVGQIVDDCDRQLSEQKVSNPTDTFVRFEVDLNPSDHRIVG